MLDASDAAFSLFKVEVTNADGSTSVMTLAQLGITSINLIADLTAVKYSDGSAITGETTFTRTVDGVTTAGTVANTILATEVMGYAVTKSVSTDASGNRVATNTAYASDGSIASITTSTTSPDGHNITNSYDTNGDGVADQVQSIITTVDGAGTRTETLTNRNGGGVLLSTIQTVSSSDGTSVTISRDSTGGGWFDQTETRTTFADGHRSFDRGLAALVGFNSNAKFCLAAWPSQVERQMQFNSSLTNHSSQSKHSARQERLQIKQLNRGFMQTPLYSQIEAMATVRVRSSGIMRLSRTEVAKSAHSSSSF